MEDDYKKDLQQPRKKTTIKEFFTDDRYRRNTIIMIFLWSACSFNFYLMNFQLKYLNASVYYNAYASSISDMVGFSCSAFLYKKVRLRYAFCICYSVSVLGGLLYLFFGYNLTFEPYFIFLGKLGIAACFNGVYIANNSLYPTTMVSTAFGMFQVLSRMATIVAPELAEIENYLPMTVYVIVGICACLASLLIKTEKM